MSASRRYCLRGHDTSLVGRTPSGNCRECEKIRDHERRAYKRRLYAGLDPSSRFDLIQRLTRRRRARRIAKSLEELNG